MDCCSFRPEYGNRTVFLSCHTRQLRKYPSDQTECGIFSWMVTARSHCVRTHSVRVALRFCSAAFVCATDLSKLRNVSNGSYANKNDSSEERRPIATFDKGSLPKSRRSNSSSLHGHLVLVLSNFLELAQRLLTSFRKGQPSFH